MIFNKTKDFDKLLEKAQKATYNGQHKQALDSLEKAERILKALKNSEPRQWAWIYDSKRYALYELGKHDEALQICRQAIAHLNETQLFPYLSEDCHVRATLRAAHNTLSWTLCQRAQNETECQTALQHINTCMSLTSPIEGPHQLKPFYETQAIVLLRMCELATEKSAFQTQLFAALTKMMKTDRETLENNPKLKEVCDSTPFQEYFALDPEAKLTAAPDCETAEQALERYQAALDHYGQIAPDYADYYGFEDFKGLDESQISKHEEFSAARLPAELRNFALKKGVLKIGTFDTKFAILEHWDEEQIARPGLANFINYCWGGRPEFEEFYRPHHIEHIDKNFTGFGVRYIDDNCHEYLFFDHDGNFDSIFMDQDYFGEFQQEFNPLLKTTLVPSPRTFSSLVSEQITSLIEKLQEEINDS